MCSIANLFDTNIRKFDPEKHFFCPERLDCKSSGKIIFFKNKISVIKVEVSLIFS